MIRSMLKLVPRYRFEQLSSELYFINQRDTYASHHPKSIHLKPLLGANQGFIGQGKESSDECIVTGIPYNEVKQRFQDYDIFNRLNARYALRQLIQASPRPYFPPNRSFTLHSKAALPSPQMRPPRRRRVRRQRLSEYRPPQAL